MGTNYPGEIEILSRSVEPDIAVLTNIGPVHLEGLGSIEGVAREKSTLFKGLKSDGLAVLNDSLSENPIILDALPDSVISYGMKKDSDYSVDYLGSSLNGSRFRVNRPSGEPVEISWGLSGVHMAQNAAAAVAIADYLGIDDNITIKALNECRLPGMRMRIEIHNKITWINDAYNANPGSMKALIDWLSSIEENIDFLILGDMLELGPDEKELHKEVFMKAREQLPETNIIGFGSIMSSLSDIESYTEIDSLKASLSSRLSPGSIIAIKGSRGMALERLIP